MSPVNVNGYFCQGMHGAQMDVQTSPLLQKRSRCAGLAFHRCHAHREVFESHFLSLWPCINLKEPSHAHSH